MQFEKAKLSDQQFAGKAKQASQWAAVYLALIDLEISECIVITPDRERRIDNQMSACKRYLAVHAENDRQQWRTSCRVDSTKTKLIVSKLSPTPEPEAKKKDNTSVAGNYAG